MRAAIYARVSSAAQATEDKTSLAEQIGEMESYCSDREYEIVARYQDIASGSTKRRFDFQRMLADARAGVFNVILCWKSDRLSRGIYPAAALMEVVEAYDVQLEAVRDTIDQKTFAIYAAVGKIEIDNFKERATLGKRGAAKRGRIPSGTLPYGYRIGEDGGPEIHPDEAPIVQRIFREYVEEERLPVAIARGLTADATPRRNGSKWGKWDSVFILSLLRRETYTGTWWYGRERHKITEDGPVITAQPRDQWIPIPFPLLIDQDMWDRAEKLRQKRKRTARRNTQTFYLLQHFMVCEECGLRFSCRSIRKTAYRANGRSYSYEYDPPHRHYGCGGMIRRGQKCRERPYMKAGPIEKLVWSEVAAILKMPKIIMQAFEGEGSRHNAEKLSRQIAQAERDLQRVQTEEDMAIRLHISGKITEAQLDTQRKFITERVEYAREKLDHLKEEERALQHRDRIAENVQAMAEEIGVGIDALTDDGKKEVLKLVLDRVGIDSAGNVKISLAIPEPEFLRFEQAIST